ncbi:MAG: DUF6338 family protein [Terriglobales bacterium]
MQFDVTGFLIFLGFILPGFLAQRARYSLAPRSLKPLSPIAEVGEFVLAGVWVHVFLVAIFRLYFWVFQEQHFAALANTLYYKSLPKFLWAYRTFVFTYLVLSLAVGYCFGFIQGWLIIKQPVRSWLARRPLPKRLLKWLGIPGFLQEDPVWYFVLKQKSAATMVFLEVEMKNGAGIYTGRLTSYGILDDSVKSKDFYLEDVHFKADRIGSFTPLDCDGILLNFEDVAAIQVRKGEPEEFLEQQATVPGDDGF